jgi:hypothetical protein
MSTMKVWWRTQSVGGKARSILSTIRRRLNGKLAREVTVSQARKKD